ncbi:acyl CoA:acetate/3-ketoacid CoA transferase subunit beta, partial [Bacillus spizizenii]|nr:acyl CoA:acetate/3-ketoacid CoA transferase subunit beta [Bacillus spizizenii]
MGLGVAEREQIAKPAPAENKPGMILKLGKGIPY